MFGRYSWYNRDSIYNEYTGYPETSGTWFQFQSWQAVVDDVHVFNPTTVLNVRYGYNRFDRNSGQQEEARNYDLTSLGFPAQYNSLIPEANRYFPRLDFDGTTMIDVAFGNDFRPITTHSASATLNKSMGAHALKGGVEMRIYGERSRSTGNDQAGRYQFTNAYTRQNSASGTDYSGPAELRGVPARDAVDHVGHPRGVLRRALHHVRVLRAGRLARQRQADAELRPALRGRDAAGRGQRQSACRTSTTTTCSRSSRRCRRATRR